MDAERLQKNKRAESVADIKIFEIVRVKEMHSALSGHW